MLISRFSTLVLCLLLCTPVISPAQLLQNPNTGPSLDDLLSLKVSTASFHSQLVSEAPASVSIVSAEEIRRFGFRTLAELLSYVRGFYCTDDRNYSYVGVRGFGRPTDYNNRVLLLWNGHVLNDNVYSSAALGNDFALNMSSIERVEVVRGPGSPLYGSNAMFAVINVISKTGNDLRGLSVEGEYGTFETARGSVLWGTRATEDIDVAVSGSWLDSRGADLYYPEYDTPETGDGIVRRMDWEQAYGFSGRIAVGSFMAQGIFSMRRKGIPTGSYESIFGDTRANTADSRWGAVLGYDFEPAVGLRVQSRASFDGYDYTGVYPYETLLYDGNRGRWWGGKVQAQWDVFPFNRLDAGVEVRSHSRADYRIWTSEGYDYDYDAPYEVTSVFAQNTYQMFTNLSLSAAVRVDRHSIAGWMTSPRATVIYNPFTQSTVKLLYGEAFRPPSISELYYEEAGVQKSNPSLLAERIRSLELSVDQRLADNIHGSVSFYQYTIRNLIDLLTDESDGLLQSQNRGVSRARGAEAEVLLQHPQGHLVSTGVSVQYASDLQSGLELTNSPRIAFRLASSVSFGPRLIASVQALYETSRVTVRDVRTDPYLLVHFTMNARLVDDMLETTLLVRNLFNSVYAYPGGFEHRQAAIPQDGRTVALRVNLQW